MITFEETGLIPELVSAVKDLGFTHPTPIQEKAIPILLETDKDIVGLAQTGTGKTAAFGLPMIQLVDPKDMNVQAIALTPTRELALQINRDLNSFSKYIKGLRVTPVYGGTDIRSQIRSLRDGTQIVVGTPGRVLDLVKRGVLDLSNVRLLALDEADEMLNMGFKEDLDLILGTMPENKKTLLFSATMPKEIARIANRYMKDSVEISTGKANRSAENIVHKYYVVYAKNRYKALKRLADVNPHIYGIIFCRTRRETQEVADHLIRDGYNADAIHGDLSQQLRTQVMDRFRSRHLQLLVATDVAARGLDVNDITHIINYNLPDDLEAYIHRSGRTGRAGKSGLALSMITGREERRIRDIERIIGKKMERALVPGGEEICEKQLLNLIDKIENVEISEEQISKHLPAINEKLEKMSKDELIKHFVSYEFNQLLAYYKDAPDLNKTRDERYSRDSRDSRDGRGGRGRDGRGARDSRGSRDRRDSRGGSGYGDRIRDRYGDSGRGGRDGGRSGAREERSGGNRESRRRSESSGKWTRFFINLGSKDNVAPQNLIGFINEQTQNRDISIGKIETMKTFSFFEVDSKFEGDILSSLNKSKRGNTKVVVEISKPDPKSNADFDKSKKKKKKRKAKD